MKKILIIISISTLLFSCDRNQKTGTWLYQIENNTPYALKISMYNTIEDSLENYVSISANDKHIKSTYWCEQGCGGEPAYFSSDSVFIIFDNAKILKYVNETLFTVNNKNICVLTYYTEEILENSKKTDSRSYTFTITEQDYAVADSL